MLRTRTSPDHTYHLTCRTDKHQLLGATARLALRPAAAEQIREWRPVQPRSYVGGTNERPDGQTRCINFRDAEKSGRK